MTKNTDKNSPITRSGAQLHPELALPNTNQRKEYQATLCYTQRSQATVSIIAQSLAEARAKADKITPELVDDWDPVDGELYVEFVELAEGGENHD